MSLTTRILKLRPLLWIAGVLLLAYLVSFTWERQTSYDDGGLGTLSFLIVTLFSVPGEFLGLGFAASVFFALAILVFSDVVIGLKFLNRPHV